jgi:DUF4097 and DUF4098 domain-containing protein YvlB
MTVQRTARLAVLTLIALGVAPAAHAQIASATGMFERRLSVSGPVDLDVRTGSGSIEIRRGAASEVRIIGTIRAQRGFWNRSSAEERVQAVQAAPPIEQSGNSIRIGQFRNESLGNNISISYEIQVPTETSLRSRTGSGSQRIDSLTGRLEVSTGSGSLRVGQITGAVTASTGSGSIQVQGATEGLNARTGSGSIEATGVRGALRAHTGSGGVNIEGNPTSDWTVHTGSGGIGLRLPSTAAFALDARSGSGSINTSHPLVMRGSLSRRHLQGQVRGGGPLVTVSAGSGSIRLE